MERQMDQNDDKEHQDKGQYKQRPVYTIRQPPLIQPLRLSAFSQKTNIQLGIILQDLAQEWVVVFKAISGGNTDEGMLLHIPDTVLLSPSGQPNVWYSTSSSGRVKAKDLMRVSPQAICKAFQPQSDMATNSNHFPAVRRLGFQVDTLSPQQLKRFCTDMEAPDILLPSGYVSATSTPTFVGSGLTKDVFCLQKHVPCHKNASFLIVWRHSPVLSDSQPPGSRTPHSVLGKTDRATLSPLQIKAHSDVFLLTQVQPEDCDNFQPNKTQTLQQTTCRVDRLDIEFPEIITWKTRRKNGFDSDVMAPLLFYMKRVTSEIANCINLGRHTRQASGLACEFFVGENKRNVYFSALRGIQWTGNAPSWETLREVDSLSRSLCEYYENTSCYQDKSKTSLLQQPQLPLPNDKTAYYELNPRFPSVYTPFAGDKQWIHRSQLVAPDISPRYLGASVPKIYRDGVFQSLLTANQADSVVRLNLSPLSLTGVRAEQPHLSLCIRRKPLKNYRPL